MDFQKPTNGNQKIDSQIYKFFVSVREKITNFIVLAAATANALFVSKPTDSAQKRRQIYFGGLKDKRFVNTKYPPLISGSEAIEDAVAHESRFIVSPEGLVMHAQKWSSKAAPKALVCFVHGYSTPAFFNYEWLCRCLAHEGFVVVSLDGRGHGLSDGLNAFIDDAEAYTDDHRWFLKETAKRHKGLDCHLLGVSMGCAVIAKLLDEDKEGLFAGAVLVSPLIEISKNLAPNAAVIAAAKALRRLFPRFKAVWIKTRPELFFNDLELAQTIDEYSVFYRDSPRLATSLELLRFAKEARRLAPLISHPLLLVQGGADRATSPESARIFFEQVAARDKEYRLYEGSSHSLLFEENGRVAFQDIVKWLNEHSREHK